MGSRILVIDDEEAIRKSFILAFEESEYQIDTAESGEKGIELERKGNYDLIFLDLKMPGLNGVETLHELRKLNADVPIYIITAFFEEFFEELKEVERDGIKFELLRKPFSSEQIVLTANSVLNGPKGI